MRQTVATADTRVFVARFPAIAYRRVAAKFPRVPTVAAFASFARADPLLQLPPRVRCWLFSSARAARFSHRGRVFAQGDPATHFAMVLNGEVKLVRSGGDAGVGSRASSKQRREVAILGPTQLPGIASCFPAAAGDSSTKRAHRVPAHLHTVEAAGETEVLLLDRHVVVRSLPARKVAAMCKAIAALTTWRSGPGTGGDAPSAFASGATSAAVTPTPTTSTAAGQASSRARPMRVLRSAVTVMKALGSKPPRRRAVRKSAPSGASLPTNAHVAVALGALAAQGTSGRPGTVAGSKAGIQSPRPGLTVTPAWSGAPSQTGAAVPTAIGATAAPAAEAAAPAPAPATATAPEPGPALASAPVASTSTVEAHAPVAAQVEPVQPLGQRLGLPDAAHMQPLPPFERVLHKTHGSLHGTMATARRLARELVHESHATHAAPHTTRKAVHPAQRPRGGPGSRRGWCTRSPRVAHPTLALGGPTPPTEDHPAGAKPVSPRRLLASTAPPVPRDEAGPPPSSRSPVRTPVHAGADAASGDGSGSGGGRRGPDDDSDAELLWPPLPPATATAARSHAPSHAPAGLGLGGGLQVDTGGLASGFGHVEPSPIHVNAAQFLPNAALRRRARGTPAGPRYNTTPLAVLPSPVGVVDTPSHRGGGHKLSPSEADAEAKLHATPWLSVVAMPASARDLVAHHNLSPRGREYAGLPRRPQPPTSSLTPRGSDVPGLDTRPRRARPADKRAHPHVSRDYPARGNKVHSGMVTPTARLPPGAIERLRRLRLRPRLGR